MKFILIVLGIKFLASVLTRKKHKGEMQNEGMMNEDVRHPSEYQLR